MRLYFLGIALVLGCGGTSQASDPGDPPRVVAVTDPVTTDAAPRDDSTDTRPTVADVGAAAPRDGGAMDSRPDVVMDARRVAPDVVRPDTGTSVVDADSADVGPTSQWTSEQPFRVDLGYRYDPANFKPDPDAGFGDRLPVSVWPDVVLPESFSHARLAVDHFACDPILVKWASGYDVADPQNTLQPRVKVGTGEDYTTVYTLRAAPENPPVPGDSTTGPIPAGVGSVAFTVYPVHKFCEMTMVYMELWN